MAFIFTFVLWCFVSLLPFSANAVVVSKLLDCCSRNVVFLYNSFIIPLDGAHYIELDLVIEECVSDKVHYNIKITLLNNVVS